MYGRGSGDGRLSCCLPHCLTAQDENAAGSRSRALQQERLAGLQSVCLQLDQQAAGGSISIDGGGTGSGGGGQHAELLQQLTSTLRALGPANGATAAGAGKLPPAVAAGKVTRSLPLCSCPDPASATAHPALP